VALKDPARPVAFFDLDGTLTRHDTLLAWIAVLIGWPRTMAAYSAAAGSGWRRPDSFAADWRGRIKCALLDRTVRGIAAADAAAAGADLRNAIGWKAPIVDALRAHAGLGHRIVVVTGAPQIYLEALLADLPVDEMLGTRLELVDGRLTGRLAEPNPVRTAKRLRVEAWLERNGPTGERWGYGNAPHDLPMLELVDHRIVV
jgi:HAD superfamily hydrolase (TIGR01490 family)